MFDDVAERYDLTNDVLSLGQTRRWRRAVVAAVDRTPGRAGARPGRRHRDQHRCRSPPPARTSCRATSPSGMLAGRQARAARARLLGRRRAAAAVRRRGVRRRDDLLRAAQRLRRRRGARRDAAGDPARRPAGGLRVQPPDLGAVPHRLHRVPDARAAGGRPAGRPATRTPTSTWPSRSGPGRTSRRWPAGSAAGGWTAWAGATSPAASSPCTARPGPEVVSAP